MNFSKALAVVAVSGMAAGLMACGGGAAANAEPETAAPAAGEKQGCKGEGHTCQAGKCSGAKPEEKPAEGATAPATGDAAAPK